MKETFRRAWRQCRLLNWGTLHFGFSAKTAEACRYAYEKRRHEHPSLRMRLCYRRAGHNFGAP